MQLVRNQKSDLSIDMAPLVDVVFQLLVFFMLTASFSSPSIKLQLPKAVTEDTNLAEKLIVSIDEGGQLYLNSEAITLSLLPQKLREQFASGVKRAVHIKGDQNMPYKFFVQVMDLARQAGAQQINIVHQGE